VQKGLGHYKAAQRLGDAARKKVATMDDLLGGVAGDVRVAGCRPNRSFSRHEAYDSSSLPSGYSNLSTEVGETHSANM